jgi:predicted Holliday junction resolvase-like endonuclease
MDTSSIIILLLVLICLIVNFVMLFLVFKLLQKINKIEGFQEANANDQATALTKLTQLFDKEFGGNFETHKKMQEFIEQFAEKVLEGNKKNYEAVYYTQGFLNKMAEGLGFRTRSNLDEI